MEKEYKMNAINEVVYGLATAGVDYPELAVLMCQAIAHIAGDARELATKKPAQNLL